MPKVLLHNLSVKYATYGRGLFNFDQNAVFFAEDGDIVITREPINPPYLDYLQSIGASEKNIKFFHPVNPSPGYADIFEDAGLIRDTQGFLNSQNNRSWALDSYMVTEKEERFARELGLQLESEADYYYKIGSKSGFRLMAKTCGLAIPAGYEARRGPLGHALAAASLFLRGSLEIIIKQDEGMAGLGSFKISRNDFFAKPLNAFTALMQPPPGVIPVRSPYFVVEELIPDIFLAPSVQLYVSGHKQPEVLSLHCQRFSRNGMSYNGCFSHHWIPEKFQPPLIEEALAFAETARDCGFCGHLTLDAIIRRNGEIIWLEANPRRVFSSYPWQIVKRVLGADAYDMPYSVALIEKTRWVGESVERIMKELETHLFSKQLSRGIIPFSTELLESKGRVSVLSIGRSKEEAVSYLKNAVAL